MPPPDRGFGALGPSENTPNFRKRRCAAQKFFFPRGAQKSSPVRGKKSRHSDGGLGVTGCVPPVWPLYFGTLLHSISDLKQQKGRLRHAYLEKPYNFGFPAEDLIGRAPRRKFS